MDVNEHALATQNAILARWPRAQTTLWRECDVNLVGEYSPHAWKRAVDFWVTGPFGRRRVRKSVAYALAHVDEMNLELVAWDRLVYMRERGFEPAPIPPERVQHTDHAHFQFLPVTEGTPPGCS